MAGKSTGDRTSHRAITVVYMRNNVAMDNVGGFAIGKKCVDTFGAC